MTNKQKSSSLTCEQICDYCPRRLKKLVDDEASCTIRTNMVTPLITGGHSHRLMCACHDSLIALNNVFVKDMFGCTFYYNDEER